MKDSDYSYLREKMVREQLISRGISDKRVLDAFRNIPREIFVPNSRRPYAYEDTPVSIGLSQTISQPYIVALMTELLSIKENDKVLEVGTGSGYQAAILKYLGAEVYTVERFSQLAEKAEKSLGILGYKVNIKIGDGSLGWSDYAPYDKIIVAAASFSVPSPLIKQLKVDGLMVLPLGGRWQQELTLIRKRDEDLIEKKPICGCIFVPLVGEYGYKE